jgi:hypothetical protein
MFRSLRRTVTLGVAVTTAVALFVGVTAADASPNPSITSFTPASATVGATVEIDGSGLSGATVVAFNLIAAQFSIVGDSEITATVPLGEDRGPITVTTPAGTATSSTSFGLIGLYVTTTTLPSAERSAWYSQQLSVGGGTAPYTWSHKGKLPTGLTMTRAGLLSGVVSRKARPHTYSFTVRVRDSTQRHRLSATQLLSLVVS